MKKINIFLASAMVLSFAACDDKSDLGVMQVNPQESIMSANGVEVKFGSDLTGDAIQLEKFDDKRINVIELVKADDLPADGSISYRMQVSPTADFAQYKTLDVNYGAVMADDWEDAYLSMIGKSPLPAKNHIRFEVYAENGSSLVRMGGDDFYYAQKELTVTPYDLKLPVEAKYSLTLGDRTVEMDHSAKHQYDDPVFSYLFDVTADEAANGLKWNITSAKGVKYGVSDSGEPEDMAGSLMIDGADGVIKSAGKLKIEVNMLDLTYNISYAFDYIYTPGPANGWGFVDNMLLYTGDFVNYRGFVYVDSEFKFCAQADWNPLNWGSEDGVNLSQGGSNIKVDENGLYWITVNITELTFAMTHITQVGMIGGFNEWNGDVNLTPSADYKTWTGDITVTEPTEWKFRMNGAWDVNLGGTADNLDLNGGNLSFSEAGTYTVTLNLGTLPYSCTIVKK